MISCIYHDNMADCIKYIESFTVFNNGERQEILKDNLQFNKILKHVEELFSSSRVMPAFGVSLHAETLNALQNDVWLQINFNCEIEKNSMVFNALLFKLELTGGINLIRLYEGRYDGRCIHLDLDNSINLTSILN